MRFPKRPERSFAYLLRDARYGGCAPSVEKEAAARPLGELVGAADERVIKKGRVKCEAAPARVEAHCERKLGQVEPVIALPVVIERDGGIDPMD